MTTNRPTWLQKDAERALPHGERALLRRDDGIVYPRLDASIVRGGRRATRIIRRRERRSRPERQRYFNATPNLPAWW